MVISVKRVRSVLLLATVASLGPAQSAGVAQQSDGARLIAHVRHNDVHFSISIERPDNRFLTIVVPTRSTPSANRPNPVNIRLRFRDDSVVEAPAQAQPSAGSGGFVDWRYRFDARRELTMANIFSVTISLAGEPYEVYPW
jgi:hypothetical protein